MMTSQKRKVILIDVDRVIKFPSRYWVHSSIQNKSRNRLAVSGFLLIFANVNSKLLIIWQRSYIQ